MPLVTIDVIKDVFTPEQTDKVVDAAEDHVMGVLNRSRMVAVAPAPTLIR